MQLRKKIANHWEGSENRSKKRYSVGVKISPEISETPQILQESSKQSGSSELGNIIKTVELQLDKIRNQNGATTLPTYIFSPRQKSNFPKAKSSLRNPD